ncbi:nose resistant to fluoxetine protein 6-like [Centruroides sculpturatus]|uniref:nose resistant to fluoxetine protein 6-like n=1 Tax=Centruroides sculpturatus TaxID=218467 RepID=UPI000C6D1B13|nr:nose resistant to fluoxetine protein 6-like [Centruroides sculpturatus]
MFDFPQKRKKPHLGLGVFGFFIVWVLLGTILDILMEFFIPVSEEKYEYLKILSSVSICASVKKLTNTDFNEKTRFIFGIKFFAICSIIFGHILFYMNTKITPAEYILNFANIYANPAVEISTQSLTITDTFFIFSGFLSFYLRKSEELNSILYYFIYIVKRYIRLTFAVCVHLAFVIILPLLVDGPHRNIVENEKLKAESKWLTFILHYYNFYNDDIDFISVLWFANVLMQLTLLTTLIFFIYDRWPKIGLAVIIVLTITGFVNFLYVSIKNELVLMFGIDSKMTYVYILYSNILNAFLKHIYICIHIFLYHGTSWYCC